MQIIKREKDMKIDKSILDEKNLKKLEYLNNPYLMEIVDEFVHRCKPDKVTVITDSSEDISYVRQLTLKTKEETRLAMEGHTIHFDGYYDLARDVTNTRILTTPEMKFSKVINTKEREEGLKEVYEIMDGIMKGRECLIRFFCLGPQNSKFSIHALQITDSSYVAHSEDILYRKGYESFKKLNGSKDFFYFIHSAGELDERGNCKNFSKRRMYIDLKGYRVITLNNQYAGNSLGLKKLALRLAIYKSDKEGWLTEHMFIMGVKPQDKKRITYFTGAFPSACGKTSTAMIPGQTIVGDDIAYIKIGKDGKAYTVNIEQGIFGIIEDVNPVDDPVIYKTLTTPRELIFSNVLVKDGVPYWLGMGKEIPKEGFNYSGEWKEGKKDNEGNTILPAHKNARYTIRLSELENVDENQLTLELLSQPVEDREQHGGRILLLLQTVHGLADMPRHLNAGDRSGVQHGAVDQCIVRQLVHRSITPVVQRDVGRHQGRAQRQSFAYPGSRTDYTAIHGQRPLHSFLHHRQTRPLSWMQISLPCRKFSDYSPGGSHAHARFTRISGPNGEDFPSTCPINRYPFESVA